MKVLIAYVPVLHQGYIDFFERHKDPETWLFLISEKLACKLVKPLCKDIRAISAEKMRHAISALGIIHFIGIVEDEAAFFKNSFEKSFILPNEDISHIFVREAFNRLDISFSFESTFLRWDSKKIQTPAEITPDRVVDVECFEREFAFRAKDVGKQSADWWRQVGAIAMNNGHFLFSAFNRHMPSDYSMYALGDPRSYAHKGFAIELSTAEHAEACIVAEAAKAKNCSLEGTQLYVSTFPCPPCAKLIARAGIKTLYYLEGYAMLDGVDVLHDAGIEIVLVK